MNLYRVTISGALGDVQIGIEGFNKLDVKYVARAVYSNIGRVKRIEKI